VNCLRTQESSQCPPIKKKKNNHESICENICLTNGAIKNDCVAPHYPRSSSTGPQQLAVMSEVKDMFDKTNARRKRKHVCVTDDVDPTIKFPSQSLNESSDVSVDDKSVIVVRKKKKKNKDVELMNDDQMTSTSCSIEKVDESRNAQLECNDGVMKRHKHKKKKEKVNEVVTVLEENILNGVSGILPIVIQEDIEPVWTSGVVKKEVGVCQFVNV